MLHFPRMTLSSGATLEFGTFQGLTYSWRMLAETGCGDSKADVFGSAWGGIDTGILKS